MNQGKRLVALLLALCMMGGNILPVYAEETTPETAAVEMMEVAEGENGGQEEPSEGEEAGGDDSEGDESENDEGEGDKSEDDKSEGDESEGDTSEEEQPQEPVKKKPWSIATDKKSYTAEYKETFTIRAKCDGKLSYSSANKSIATVNQSGVVTIQGVGSTTITITAEEDDTHEETSVSVSVKGTKAKQSITVKKKSISVQMVGTGTVFSLGASAASGCKLTYKSSNTKVVEVSSSGEATAKDRGTAVITITASESKYYQKNSCTITVTVTRKAPVLLSYSSSYKKSKYYKALMALGMSGTQSVDVVNIALSQLGYCEGKKSSQLAGTVAGHNNYTEYGRYYGMNGQPWCAMFISWCAREAGVSTKAVPRYAACASYYSYFKKQKCFYSWAKLRTQEYTPKQGDIILFAYTKGGTAHHIGYVTGVTYTAKTVSISTVEGNSGDKVKERTYTLSRSSGGKTGGYYILGVAHPKY